MMWMIFYKSLCIEPSSARFDILNVTIDSSSDHVRLITQTYIKSMLINSFRAISWNQDTYKVSAHGSGLESPAGALHTVNTHTNHYKTLVHPTDQSPCERWEMTDTYLLIKQGPKHGQRNIEEQHLQHHLYLSDKKFL